MLQQSHCDTILTSNSYPSWLSPVKRASGVRTISGGGSGTQKSLQMGFRVIQI